VLITSRAFLRLLRFVAKIMTAMSPPPLAGVRVVDMTRFLAGAGATRILGNLGAEVIKVEWPHFPALDLMRVLPPFANGEPGLNRSGFFNQINVDKLSISLNMKTDRGRSIAERLIGVSDVLVENFTPGVMERWGLGWKRLQEIKPSIVYVAISGFGQSGPYSSYRTYGPIAQAYSGMQAMVGLPGLEPTGWGFSILDHMAAYHGAITVMMGLHNRARTGKGLFVDLSQAPLGCTLLGPALLDSTVNGRRYEVPGNRSTQPGVAPHNAYRCRGGDEWVVIEVRTNEEWQALCSAMGNPEWARSPNFTDSAGREANELLLDGLIERWTSTHDRFDVMELLQASGVPAGVVQDARDKLQRDPQLAHYGLYAPLEHPEVGRRTYEGIPLRFARTPARVRQRPPLLGEHTRHVFRDLLGLSDAEFEELSVGGVTTNA
jgi:crotonobetainyl-CoA:carnitine CoA-transferase CaiB-like acyl-CoA transferase